MLAYHTSLSIFCPRKPEGQEVRIAAKKAKDFAEADRIRKALLEAGVVLEDSAQGTTWRRV